MRIICIALLFVFVLISCSSLSLVNLTPDIISSYGLNQKTIQNTQFYFRSINVHADSTVSKDEPTRFVRVDTKRVVTDQSSSALRIDSHSQEGIIIIKDNTPCKIVDVLQNGTVLRAVFDTAAVKANQVEVDFKLSYRAGYSFELVTDTIFYKNMVFVRFPTPLVENIGLLCVDKKRLSTREIVIPGRIVN